MEAPITKKQPTVSAKVEDARRQLASLREAADELADAHAATDAPSEELVERGEHLRRAMEEAKQQLERPRLLLATVGTTSSGKSTLVNALAGRRLAPIEAAEMSSGLLRLCHDEKRAFEVEATQGAAWETGTWEVPSDEAAYERARGVMQAYRDKRTAAAPRMTATGPLLPSADPDLFGLGAEVAVEFMDLPGLKSVGDRDNLKTIQRQVRRAFSIVTLDYGQTDEEHRRKLIGELQNVVEFLGGRTDLMLFVLNRVDHRSRDDDPLEERVELLQKEIRQALDLDVPPPLMTLEAQALYYAQCAWGAAALDEAPSAPLTTQRHMMKGLLDDCAGSVRKMKRAQPELQSVFEHLDEAAFEDAPLPENDLRRAVRAVWEYSGGNALLDRMRERVDESLPELVLAPALMGVLSRTEEWAKRLRPLAKNGQQESDEQLRKEQQRLHEAQDHVEEKVESVRRRFKKKLEEAVDDLKARGGGDLETRQRLAEKLGEGFDALLRAVNVVRDHLNAKLVQPVRKAVADRHPPHDLEDALTEEVGPEWADQLARAYGKLLPYLDMLVAENGKLVREAKKSNEEKVKRLRDAERWARCLYKTMRDALTERAEFELQIRANKITESLRSLVKRQADEVEAICQEVLPNSDYAEAVDAVRRTGEQKREVELPARLFTLPDAAESGNVDRTIQTGTEKETYQTGSCFKKKKTRTKPVYDDVEYHRIELPNAKGMAEQWLQGVAQGEDQLWNELGDWMAEALDASANDFADAIGGVLGVARTFIERHLEHTDDEYAAQKTRWKRVEAGANGLLEARATLMTTARSEHA